MRRGGFRVAHHAHRDRRQAQHGGQRGPFRSRMKARLAEWGATALPGSPADFGNLIADETEKWAKVIKFESINPHDGPASAVGVAPLTELIVNPTRLWMERKITPATTQGSTSLERIGDSPSEAGSV